MDDPDRGEIYFSGRPASRLDEEERAKLRSRRLGFVFQFDSLLPEFTILENVTMPARIAADHAPSKNSGEKPPIAASLKQAEKRALELLSGFAIEKLKNRLPTQISGGERQRVALCRALINHPTVVLADEPTGNLDKANGELVFKDLRRLAEKHDVAVIMVTHNEISGQYAHRIVQMEDGRVEERPARLI